MDRALGRTEYLSTIWRPADVSRSRPPPVADDADLSVWLSGSRAGALLPPSPLGTVRERLRSRGSSPDCRSAREPARRTWSSPVCSVTSTVYHPR
jgi:hypothetical protein